MLKRIVFTLYVLVIVTMAAATFIEKSRGTDFVHTAVYGSWWFTALWALLAVAAVVYIVRRRVRRLSTLALHLALLLILAGALLTHVSAWRGRVHLRSGLAVDTYYKLDRKGNVSEEKLPFTMRLDTFIVSYHEGTQAEADYTSRFTVSGEGRETQADVSMNKIYEHGSLRFYQASYDRDLLGSVLAVNCDPWGIPVTYAGYALLFAALVWMLFDPKGRFRRLLRSPLLQKGTLCAVLFVCFSVNAKALNALPLETADKFGRLFMVYNGRVCPVQTFAVDFTKKLTGASSYNGMTAEQVLTGFIFYGDEWSAEPLIKVKNGALRDALQLPARCTVNTFFNPLMGGYILGPYVREYYQGQTDKLHRQAAEVDDRLMMLMQLRRGGLLKVFPVTRGGRTQWYAPTDNIADTLVGDAERAYIANVFSLLNEEVHAGRTANVDLILGKMLAYQEKNAGSSLPSDAQVKAERALNAVPFATILFMVNLALGIIFIILLTAPPTLKGSPTYPPQGEELVTKAVKNTNFKANFTFLPLGRVGGAALSLLSFIALTLCLALRWVASGRVPMGNGYETMLLLAWLVMLVALAVARRFRIALPFGLLLSGFFLLVSHISSMDPQISHLMPVLNSPLLSLHVSVIMAAFALLSLTFLCAVTALLLRLFRGRNATGLADQTGRLALLSRLMLYPALALLGIGIFVGAVWANVSWGAYWNWDAKEVWGLITLMVYAVAAHDASLSFLRRPLGYHAFMALAFLTIVMTYFGVNYYLGGMHSYA
ncbi:MAG TPA: cytochrome c biogenesis protein CcsA [Candidatus Prevotella stercoripullorum]|nr:cytochrome c biogenesis protein CcsA [Candidatus Prevotella stercoripullorum]